MSHKNVEHFHR